MVKRKRNSFEDIQTAASNLNDNGIKFVDIPRSILSDKYKNCDHIGWVDPVCGGLFIFAVIDRKSSNEG